MKDKVVVITGASSGIGMALAKEFAKHHSRIVIAARGIEKLQELATELQQNGVDVLCVKADIQKEEDCVEIIKKTVEKFNRIDILINNAGISMRAFFDVLEISVMKKVMDTNFWGTVYCTKYALPYLLESKGSVVAVSSISGFVPLPGRTGYCASKYAIHGFMETLRIENLKNGLHVMVIAPGYTSSNIRKNALVADGSIQGDTPRNEEKMMSADVVAKQILMGIKKRKRTVILTLLGKATVFINKLFPAFIDKQAYNLIKNESENSSK